MPQIKNSRAIIKHIFVHFSNQKKRQHFSPLFYNYNGDSVVFYLSFVVAPIVCRMLCSFVLRCSFSVLSSFAIFLPGKAELIILLHCNLAGKWLSVRLSLPHGAMGWCVIVAFSLSYSLAF